MAARSRPIPRECAGMSEAGARAGEGTGTPERPRTSSERREVGD